MSKFKAGPITKKIVEWLEAKDWDERPEPTDDKDLTKVAFRFAAGGELELDCLLFADESGIGMLSIVAVPDFSITESNIERVGEFCGHFRKKFGNIYVMEDGSVNYIDSRGLDLFKNAIDDVPTEIENMINEMDEYVAWLAPFIVDISNGVKEVKKCIKQAEKKIPQSYIPKDENG